MESVQKQGSMALAKSPNKQNCFWMQVMPEAEETHSSFLDDDCCNILSIDENRNVLVDFKSKTDVISGEALEAIIAGFEYACRAGPLCGDLCGLK
jgi:translation elongation factor EF-G